MPYTPVHTQREIDAFIQCSCGSCSRSLTEIGYKLHKILNTWYMPIKSKESELKGKSQEYWETMPTSEKEKISYEILQNITDTKYYVKQDFKSLDETSFIAEFKKKYYHKKFGVI